MPQNKRIYIAGHNGMVGQALCRRLYAEGHEILTATRSALDLRSQADTKTWLSTNKPDAVIVAAATVGGIADNAARPADFLYDNMMIAANIIHAAHEADINRLLFLGSSCIYPRDAAQPMREDALMTGTLEPTNEFYAIAKIAGIKLCEAYRRQYGRDYIAAMPCNLYGPGDRFDVQRSHVIPALLMKFDNAVRDGAGRVMLWGSGNPLREFLHVDDLAAGLSCLLQNYHGATHINIGSGSEVSIAALAHMIADVTGFRGDIVFDVKKPDGTPRKLMNSSAMRALGWSPSIPLETGLADLYGWYKERSRHNVAA